MRRCLLSFLFLALPGGFVVLHNPQPYTFPELLFFPEMPIADNNPVTVAGVDLGRHLFYDPILSAQQTLSCASCHRQEHAFSDAPNVKSTGDKGALGLRNTPPLFNLAWYSALFWDGRAASIEDQVFHPVRDSTEMNLDWEEAVQRLRSKPFYRTKFALAFGDQHIDSLLVSKAIGQFLRTLISNQSKYDQVIRGEAYFTEEELAGFMLVNDMTKGDCLHCHTTDANALGTTGGFSNNGLDPASGPSQYRDPGLGAITQKAGDRGRFKIPSLRNLAFTAPYMHDGRFKSIDEVLDFYSEGVLPSVNIDSKMGFAHQGGVRLSAKEKQEIRAFLLTLTDSVFVTNSEFSSPFE